MEKVEGACPPGPPVPGGMPLHFFHGLQHFSKIFHFKLCMMIHDVRWYLVYVQDVSYPLQ